MNTDLIDMAMTAIKTEFLMDANADMHTYIRLVRFGVESFTGKTESDQKTPSLAMFKSQLLEPCLTEEFVEGESPCHRRHQKKMQ